MRRLIPMLLAATLAVPTLAAPTLTHAAKAKPTATAKPSSSPVVVEWFSNLHVKTGQRDTVYVQLLEGKKGVKGAKLTATLVVHKKTVLKRITGTTTDKTGKAFAKFTVPKLNAGTKLTVNVSLKVGKHSYPGVNTLTIAK